MESLEHFMDAQILNHPSVMIIDEEMFPLSSRERKKREKTSVCQEISDEDK